MTGQLLQVGGHKKWYRPRLYRHYGEGDSEKLWNHSIAASYNALNWAGFEKRAIVGISPGGSHSELINSTGILKLRYTAL